MFWKWRSRLALISARDTDALTALLVAAGTALVECGRDDDDDDAPVERGRRDDDEGRGAGTVVVTVMVCCGGGAVVALPGAGASAVAGLSWWETVSMTAVPAPSS